MGNLQERAPFATVWFTVSSEEEAAEFTARRAKNLAEQDRLIVAYLAEAISLEHFKTRQDKLRAKCDTLPEFAEHDRGPVADDDPGKGFGSQVRLSTQSFIDVLTHVACVNCAETTHVMRSQFHLVVVVQILLEHTPDKDRISPPSAGLVCKVSCAVDHVTHVKDIVDAATAESCLNHEHPTVIDTDTDTDLQWIDPLLPIVMGLSEERCVRVRPDPRGDGRG